MSDPCLFCGIVTGAVPSATVAQDEATYAFMDVDPATEGHLLVVPRRHTRDLLEIAPDDLAAVALMGQRLARVVVDELGADGVNLLSCCGAEAWQTVFHVHLHVVPRYADPALDTLVPPWRPGVAGDPDRIAATAARLVAALGARPDPG